MRLDVVSTVNDPGVPGKTGDDRAGFDAAAGTAWVLDGATDVTDLRPFPACESGAAWIAEALSDRLMQAPQSGETPEAYFASVLADVRQRAEAETRIPLDKLPGEALPIASGIWMWLEGGEAVSRPVMRLLDPDRARAQLRTQGRLAHAQPHNSGVGSDPLDGLADHRWDRYGSR